KVKETKNMNLSTRLKDLLFDFVPSNPVPNKKYYKELTQDIHDALLDIGSHTPDNINCINHVVFGSINERSEKAQLKIAQKNFFLTDVLKYVKSKLEFVNSAKEYLPELENTDLVTFFDATITFSHYLKRDQTLYILNEELKKETYNIEQINRFLKVFFISKGLADLSESVCFERIRDENENRVRAGITINHGYFALDIIQEIENIEWKDVDLLSIGLVANEIDAVMRFFSLFYLILEEGINECSQP
ncbi:MAG: hypothetical protein K1X92_09205, partial [Bacteroidia bacterium]|nr:hypothetical protein [Bacteroidia bacterium]